VNTSLFELFKIGIGPSSSHTVGPMRAALRFVQELDATGTLERTARVQAELYGSLALTGIGHATDRAVLLGLSGEAPATVDPEKVEGILAGIREAKSISLGGSRAIPFHEEMDLVWHRRQMYPDANKHTHPNGLRITAFDASGAILSSEVFYSIGGGFILSEAEFEAEGNKTASSGRTVPYPYRSAAGLLAVAAANKLTIAELVLANEVALMKDPAVKIIRPEPEGPAGSAVERIRKSILMIWQTMQQSMQRGMTTSGILPGGLSVRRRAQRLTERLNTLGSKDPLAPMDWVTVYAMAVNEENAAGGKVVTAPTNGAAGIIPAIANYYIRFIDGTEEEKREGILRYFLTAAAIGILYKENASISGAEVGCQGEVGVACSMAAGGLVAALKGSNAQVEHAAEIAMEHNLGMTCDPIGGLVQIPCIERNGMGAVKAINACRMAMHESGDHKLSLDQVIATMYQTGLDMQSRYKETSLAGLALNVIEC
jgi:L-serine dehydratase